MRRVSNFCLTLLPVAAFALSIASFAPKAQSSFRICNEKDGIEYIFDGTDDFSTSKSTVMMAILFSICFGKLLRVPLVVEDLQLDNHSKSHLTCAHLFMLTQSPSTDAV